jgi:hypothetical protein
MPFRDLHSLDLSLDIYHWKAGNTNSDLYLGEARFDSLPRHSLSLKFLLVSIYFSRRFIFCWPASANKQLDALFHVFIYFISLHVSSFTVLIIRWSNCINTSSGMISLCEWLLGMPVRRELQTPIPLSHDILSNLPSLFTYMPVRRELQFPPDLHTKQSLRQTNHTRWCINTIRSPDDEHCDARNM